MVRLQPRQQHQQRHLVDNEPRDRPRRGRPLPTSSEHRRGKQRCDRQQRRECPLGEHRQPARVMQPHRHQLAGGPSQEAPDIARFPVHHDERGHECDAQPRLLERFRQGGVLTERLLPSLAQLGCVQCIDRDREAAAPRDAIPVHLHRSGGIPRVARHCPPGRVGRPIPAVTGGGADTTVVERTDQLAHPGVIGHGVGVDEHHHPVGRVEVRQRLDLARTLETAVRPRLGQGLHLDRNGSVATQHVVDDHVGRIVAVVDDDPHRVVGIVLGEQASETISEERIRPPQAEDRHHLRACALAVCCRTRSAGP